MVPGLNQGHRLEGGLATVLSPNEFHRARLYYGDLKGRTDWGLEGLLHGGINDHIPELGLGSEGMHDVAYNCVDFTICTSNEREGASDVSNSVRNP